MELSRRAFAAGLLAGTAMGGLGGCIATNPATGRTSFTGIYSIEDDIKLGREEYPKLIKSFGGAYEDDKVGAYVTDLGLRLAKGSETPQLPYTFTVLNSPIVNAFALPGGYVSVSRGLLALASNEAELAGVISHELGHVNARHTAERMSQGLIAQIGLLALGVATGSRALSDMAGFAAEAFIQSYSRQQEFEADMLGVRYMSRAGYDPEAMVTFLDTLRQHSQLDARMRGLPEGSVDEFNIMSTHPRTTDRVQAAIREASTQRPAEPIVARDRFLDRIDGMLFGDDPKQGMVLGRRFVHPDLGFEFTVPEGFRLSNGEKRVVAKHANGAAIVFDIGHPKGSRGALAYLRDEWAANTHLSGLETISINGQEAATGSTRISGRDGTLDVRPLVIRRDASSVYRLMFLSPVKVTTGLNRPFRETTYSFRQLGDAEARAIRPMRIHIARATARDTVEGLAGTLPYDRYNADSFRVLNDLDPGQALPLGEPIKIVVL